MTRICPSQTPSCGRICQWSNESNRLLLIKVPLPPHRLFLNPLHILIDPSLCTLSSKIKHLRPKDWQIPIRETFARAALNSQCFVRFTASLPSHSWYFQLIAGFSVSRRIFSSHSSIKDHNNRKKKNCTPKIDKFQFEKLLQELKVWIHDILCLCQNFELALGTSTNCWFQHVIW